MNYLIAVTNQQLFEALKKEKSINIISNNILYKEGILEILEKNKNISHIIFSENLNGNISIENLIQKIKNINKKIKIIIIIKKINKIKKEYLLENKIKYFLEEVTAEKIIEKEKHKQGKVIAIIGNGGSGKTITTIVLAELLKNKNKVLIIEDVFENQSIKKMFLKTIKNNHQKNILNIKENIFLWNLKNENKNNSEKNNIIFKINQLKNNFDYIFIDVPKIKEYFFYEKILEETILILNANLLEINKIRNFIRGNKKNFLAILNLYNSYSIQEEILKNIFNQKIKIIAKIKYQEKYNALIHHQFQFMYLNKNIQKEYLKIMEKIEQ